MNQNLLHFTDDCIVVAVGRLPKSVDVTSLYFFGGKEAPRPKPGWGAEFHAIFARRANASARYPGKSWDWSSHDSK